MTLAHEEGALPEQIRLPTVSDEPSAPSPDFDEDLPEQMRIRREKRDRLAEIGRASCRERV